MKSGVSSGESGGADCGQLAAGGVSKETDGSGLSAAGRFAGAGCKTSGESAGYLQVSAACQIYYVLHPCERPLARVLLVGPFASERPHSYIPWVRWARYLAAHRMEALRFDYRGVGESTGDFEQMSFGDWVDDVKRMMGWLSQRDSELPVLLCGLGLGGLLAAQVFCEGHGDSLLMWSPPASGRDALREAMMRRLAADMATTAKGQPQKSWDDYQGMLESGQCVQVDGHGWSSRLWRDSAELKLQLREKEGHLTKEGEKRPWRMVKLNRSAAPLIPGFGQWMALNPRAQVHRLPLNPDLTALFESSLGWMRDSLAATSPSVA